MAREHHIDLSHEGEARHEERVIPDEDMAAPDPAMAESLRRKEEALARLRARGGQDPFVADVLTLMGY